MTQTIDESRAALIAHLQQQTEELAELNKIAIALTSEFDLPRLLQMMTDAARRLTAAEYATFFLIPEITGDETSGRKGVFTLAAISGANERIAAHFRRLGPVEGLGLLEPVFWGDASILSDDVLNDPRYIGVPRGHIPVRSFLGVRLRSREGTPLGAFLIGDTQPGKFTTRHFELVEAMGAQAAVAIHNAQLVERERRVMEEYAAQLENEVRERTAELERRNAELGRFATDLQQLHHELTEVQKRQMLAEERSRIAQELHDRVQQTLFTMGLKADWIREQLANDSPLLPAVQAIKRLASLGTAQVRDAIFALSSAELAEDGLVKMLQSLIRDLRETSTIEADLVIAEWASAPPARVEQTLLTVAQEALLNVRRHSGATAVIVTVQVTREQAVLVVQDNGSGIALPTLQDYASNGFHLGLKGMYQRIRELGGQFLLANGEEGGLVVKAVVPL
ncbi:MAG TPA: GAF domain-containing protein [Ktedonobacteraceae bacterium]|nr:GAF domain-containing protein [Ktedonobacteraceae bacterium]